MPFTISVGGDRGRNGLAPCAPLIPNGVWDAQPLDIKQQYCRCCPFRFTARPSCNLDFMTVSDTDNLKQELAIALAWTASDDADWPALNGCIYEVDFAYHYLGLEVPSPKSVMTAFIKSCAKITPDEKFWKDWNYRWVEHNEGKPALKTTVAADVRDDVDKITLNIIEPQVYAGKRLMHLHAATALLSDIAASLDLFVLKDICSNFVEACRRAISANASLEIE